jgi:serine phosphatase RsbU (regulator of sigma subunit)
MKDEGLGKTILSDLRQNDLFRALKQDLMDIYDFYLDRQTKERLSRMGKVKRWIVMSVWLIKSMFFKLTSVRRLLLLLAFLFALFASNLSWRDQNLSINMDFRIVSFLIILVILMLELKDKLLAHDELLIGKKVQAALMPSDNPVFKGWDVWLYTRSANEVSGDLVDYLHIKPGRLGVALGDVAGKGLGAALCMARIQATLHAIAPEFHSLSKLMTQMNRIVCRDGLPTRFSTLIYGELLSNSGKVRLVNAGHYPPIVLRGKIHECLKPGAPALGITTKSKYREEKINLHKGDTLLVYSDGVTDARNEAGEHFDEKRLMQLLPGLKDLSSQQMGKAIVSAVNRFIGEARPNDDLSLVILSRTK